MFLYKNLSRIWNEYKMFNNYFRLEYIPRKNSKSDFFPPLNICVIETLDMLLYIELKNKLNFSFVRESLINH